MPRSGRLCGPDAAGGRRRRRVPATGIPCSAHLRWGVAEASRRRSRRAAQPRNTALAVLGILHPRGEATGQAGVAVRLAFTNGRANIAFEKIRVVRIVSPKDVSQAQGLQPQFQTAEGRHSGTSFWPPAQRGISHRPAAGAFHRRSDPVSPQRSRHIGGSGREPGSGSRIERDGRDRRTAMGALASKEGRMAVRRIAIAFSVTENDSGICRPRARSYSGRHGIRPGGVKGPGTA